MGNKLASTLTYHSTPSLKNRHGVRSNRVWGPPAHDQRGKHSIIGELGVPGGFGSIREFERLESLSPENGPVLKASLPGPYTLSGRIMPNSDYPDRWAITEALLPHVRDELIGLVEAGCTEITVDEPSMSCYGYKEILAASSIFLIEPLKV